MAQTRRRAPRPPSTPIDDRLDLRIAFVGILANQVVPPGDLAAALRLADSLGNGRSSGSGEPFSAELLKHQEELEFFRAMNQLKAAADSKRCAARSASRGSVRNRSLREMRELLAAALVIRNRIVAANVRLVPSAAKKFAAVRLDRSDLVSEGNFTLLRVVEKFDFSRGFRFSTYATWALRYHFQRMARRTGDPLRNRSGGSQATAFIAAPEAPDPADVSNRRRWAGVLDLLLEKLDPREQEVVRGRYGLGDGAIWSLNELARRLGVCKERVRQLQLRALVKLKGLADAHRIDPPPVD